MWQLADISRCRDTLNRELCLTLQFSGGSVCFGISRATNNIRPLEIYDENKISDQIIPS